MSGSGDASAHSRQEQSSRASADGASSQASANPSGSGPARPVFQQGSFSTPFGNVDAYAFVASFDADPHGAAAHSTAAPIDVSRLFGLPPGGQTSPNATGGSGAQLGGEWFYFSDLMEGLNAGAPPFASAAAWPLRNCPPLSAEDIVSTFDVVTPPTDTVATSAAPPPSASRNESECAICLEVFFKDAVGASTVHQPQQPSPREMHPSTEGDNRSSGKEAERNAPLLSEGVGSPSGGATQPSRQNNNDEPSSTSPVRRVYCGHLFHEACILSWISIGHYTCPVCRSPLVYE
ncbi:hypothetical protein ABL78_7177 [Leptomonas seymouri]|uniref:RING-type domain-containing protein n=1 Tax=Leptomonas seymouri TaxID=5684 RepID=A0A0N0P3K6_LEPSE|nr:hypothetical protein ABL78_7177 [Leptomonas seymouri]|eukprot:KPI83777.1 hypothetical protein ABL78_7177 [Leptomonas seymouri]